MSTDEQNAERYTWEALKEQALSAKAKDVKQCYRAYGTSGDTLEDVTVRLLIEEGSSLETDPQRLRRDTVVATVVREVFYAAQHLGLIVPGLLGEQINWDPNAYQFTTRGLAFFENGEVSLSAPGVLVERIREVVTAGDLDPGIVPLTEEAQRCWSMGCLRAAMVLIGLASEEVCTGLLEELCRYPSPPLKGEALYSDWERLNSEALSFYPRWQAGLALLESVKQGMKKAYGATRPEWWKTWEPLPGAIQPYAEAVRIARNTAAHTVGDIFTSAQVGLLLASLPTMVTVVSDLTLFLRTPPSGVVLPKPVSQ